MSREASLDPPVAALPARISALREPAVPLTVAALLAAALVGVALAAQVPAGVALLAAVVYVPLVLTDLRLGLAMFVPLLFLQGIPALNLGGEVAGLLIVFAWVGTLRSSRESVLNVANRHRRLLLALGGLLVWLTLSLAWADDTALASADLYPWWAVGVLFVIIMTTVTTAGGLRLVAAAFVAGATISALVGMFDGSLSGAIDGAARVTGGVGDANFLAASIVAAAVLACGLLASARSPLQRVLLLAAVVILIAGLVGTASRGGALAGGVTILAALVVFKRQRGYVLAATAVVLGIAAVTFVNAPAALDRVTDFENDNGRSDLWTVAWEMGKDNPVAGVGLNNFRVHSADYVQEPGGVEQVALVAETPHFVHNTYLQFLAEGGVISLALFLVLVGGCLLAAKRACDRFERHGDRSLETLARAVIVATISMLGAAVFLSAALDLRLWLLLALGPAFLAVASREGEPGDASSMSGRNDVAAGP